MKKNRLTILSAVLCAVCLSGCGDTNGNPSVRFVDRYTIYTDTVRGHVYLYIGGGGITHDPDCPCHKDNPELLNEK